MFFEEFSKEFGLSEESLQRRLEVIGLGPEDRRRIRSLEGLIHQHADPLTASFIEYLTSQDEGGLHVDRDTLDRARRLKAKHLEQMAKGEYGLDYAELRLELGILYANAGVDPRAFLAAYNDLVRNIGDLIQQHHAKAPEEGFAVFKSLIKISFFDLSLVVDVLVFERERTIRQQQEAIRGLSTPALPVREGLLILPMIGVIDSQRSRQLTDHLLKAIRTYRARVVVVDVTGVPSMDHDVAGRLLKTVTAARLTGARLVFSGVSAQVSQALIGLGLDVSSLDTFGDLRGAIEEAERVLGYKVQAPEDGLAFRASSSSSFRPASHASRNLAPPED